VYLDLRGGPSFDEVTLEEEKLMPWSDVDLPVATPEIDVACRDLSEFGYCVVEDALSTAEAAAVSGRVLDQAAAERSSALDYTYPAEAEGDDVNQWVYQLINKGSVLHRLPEHDIARQLATHVLGRDHLLSSFDSHITYPGNLAMPLHADQWWMPSPMIPGDDYERQGNITRAGARTGFHEPATHAINGPFALNVMWMITDFTVANGATRVVPMSHLSGNVPDATLQHPEVQIEGRAGSILAWDARTWHGAGLNTSTEPRVGVTTYFCGPMIRQLTNMVYGTRTEVRDVATDEFLALLGFKPWSSYGMTDDPSCAVVKPGDDTAAEMHI